MDGARNLFLAKEMLAAGFYTRIVALETKLPKKMIRKFYSRAQEVEGVAVHHARPGKEPTGLKLIKNTSSKLQASFVMGIYAAIGGKAIFGACNLKALTTANKLYQAEIAKLERDPLFDINSLWYLAKELRERIATFETCPLCNYRYFHSINQRTDLDCPFCFRSKDGIEA